MAILNVVLVGAAGNIGSYILAGLDKAGFNVTILSRQSSKATFPGRRVTTIADDYPHAELVAAFKGQDAVVSPVTLTPGGKLDGTGQFALIDAAIEAGVKRYLPSEFGADHRNDRNVELSPLTAEKRKVMKYLQSKEGKIEYTSVFTGPFFDFDLKIGFTGIDLKTNKATFTDGGDTKFSVATMAQIGEGVAAVLRHDEQTANQFVVIESFLTSQNENLAAVEKEGRKITVEKRSGQALIEGSQAGYKAGNLYAMYGLVQAALFLPGYGSDMSEDGEKWRSILGLQRLDIQQETKRVLEEINAQA